MPAPPSKPAVPAAASRDRESELAILHTIAEALNASVDLKTSLAAALSHVAAAFGLDTGWVFLLDEATGEPYLAAAQNLPSGLADNPVRMTGTCYCLDTFRDGDLNGAANINVVTCSRLKWLAGRGTEGLRFHASIPLYAHGRKLGVMNLASPEWRRLSPDDLRLLHTIGDMLSVAIDRAKLYARSIEMGAVDERNRLAREIHDTIAQGLAGIALRLDTADALLGAGDSKGARAVVAEALKLTRANLEEARRSVLDLRAAPLEERTLEEAIRLLVEKVAPSGRPSVIFEAVGAARRLPARIEVGLYRIAQEALANALRHAHAKRVTLRLLVEPERVRLAIADDGRGFEAGEERPGRFGLVGMGERVRLLGGRLAIETAPGRGARIEAEVPLN